MLIDKLNIQKFRGILGSISLDLSAPLTVIYAANGTGKTSICDALEWLLCGSIGRLKSLDKAEVKCQFGDEQLETFTEAIIPHNQKPFTIKRVLNDSNSQLYWKDNLSDYKQSTDQDLLRQIVTALPPGGNSTRAKVDWVRSTRFLESESLSLLIDSDKDSNDTRKLIFSNLFGVSEFQKSENSLDKILRKLPAERTIERGISKSNEKIYEYRELIKKYTFEKSDIYYQHIRNLFQVVANILDATKLLEKISDLYELHKSLEVVYVEFKENVDQCISTIEYFQKNISLFEENASKKENIENKIQSKKSDLDRVSSKHKELKFSHQENRSIYDKNNKLTDEISEAQSKLYEELKAFFRLFDIYMRPSIPLLEGENRLGKISELISQSEQKIIQLRSRRNQILKCLEDHPLWEKKRDSIKELKKQMADLNEKLSEEKDIQKLSGKMSDVKEGLYRLRASREKALNDLDLVLSSGKKYIEDHDDVRDCPLCEHKYKDNSELKNRIESKFSKLSERSREEADLTSYLHSLTKKLQFENNQLKNYKELADRKDRSIAELDVLEVGLIGCGIDRGKLVDQKFVLDVLGKHRDTNVKEMEDSEIQRDALNGALKAGHQLDDMRICVEFLFTQWSEMIDDISNAPSAIDTLDQSIKSIMKALNASLKESKVSKEKHKLHLEKLSGEIKKIEDEKKSKEEELLTLKTHHDVISPKHNEFIRRWKFVSESEIIDRDGIQNIISNLEKRKKSVGEINGLLKKAEEYFEKIGEQKKKDSEINIFRRELNETEKELEEWLNQKDARSIIEKEIAGIQAEVKKFVSREIKPLSTTISTLYLRAQGNKFINSISAKPTKDGLLNWIAELDDEGNSFDKMQALSQGQRQDLALSIFLARARSLGGTFFLDEPLAHLDDLNRVALLDTFRVIVSENNSIDLRLVLTTASKNLLRHLREKFSLVESGSGKPALRIYKMIGNPKIGLEVEGPELVHSPNRLLVSD